MPLNKDGWIQALHEIYPRLQAVRDLAEAIDVAKASPVGISGERYEFAMTPAQITQAKIDLINEARAARDRMNVAIQAAMAP